MSYLDAFYEELDKLALRVPSIQAIKSIAGPAAIAGSAAVGAASLHKARKAEIEAHMNTQQDMANMKDIASDIVMIQDHQKRLAKALVMNTMADIDSRNTTKTKGA